MNINLIKKIKMAFKKPPIQKTPEIRSKEVNDILDNIHKFNYEHQLEMLRQLELQVVSENKCRVM